MEDNQKKNIDWKKAYYALLEDYRNLKRNMSTQESTVTRTATGQAYAKMVRIMSVICAAERISGEVEIFSSITKEFKKLLEKDNFMLIDADFVKKQGSVFDTDYYDAVYVENGARTNGRCNIQVAQFGLYDIEEKRAIEHACVMIRR